MSQRAMRFMTGGGGGGEGVFQLSAMSQRAMRFMTGGGGGRCIPPQYNVPKEP